MMDGLAYFWFSFPILLILFSFGGGLAIRLLTNSANPLRDYGYTPKVSVLLPVFNEGEHVLETISSIMACDWPSDCLEIVAVDDYSVDDSWHWLQEAKLRWPNQLNIHRNESNSGKHVSLSRALTWSSGEILICIDSDCIFDKNVIKELVACFADPGVGAVGGNIGISNVNENVFTICQTLIYYCSFQVGKMAQNLSKRVFCISGCLFAVRRPLFEAVEHEVKTRSWFGLSVRDGEDRYMTHALLMRGCKTLVNPHAICWTAAPTKLADFFSQQIRWRRSGLRDLFWTWARIPAHVKVMGFGPLLAALIPETFTVLWMLLILSTILTNNLAVLLSTVVPSVVAFSALFSGAALVYNMTCDKLAKGSVHITHPILAGVAGAWFFMDSIVITLLALFTFDVGVWGTREKPSTNVSVTPVIPEPSLVEIQEQIAVSRKRGIPSLIP